MYIWTDPRRHATPSTEGRLVWLKRRNATRGDEVCPTRIFEEEIHYGAHTATPPTHTVPFPSNQTRLVTHIASPQFANFVLSDELKRLLHQWVDEVNASDMASAHDATRMSSLLCLQQNCIDAFDACVRTTPCATHAD